MFVLGLCIIALGRAADPIPPEAQLIGTVITGQPRSQHFGLVSIGVDKFNATSMILQADNCSNTSYGINVGLASRIVRESGSWFRLSWWHLAGFWRLDRIDIDSGACKSFTPVASERSLYNTLTLAAANDSEITAVGYAPPDTSTPRGGMLAAVIDAHTGREKLTTVVSLEGNTTGWEQGFFVGAYNGKILLEAPNSYGTTQLYEAPMIPKHTQGRVICPLVKDVSWQLDVKRQWLVGLKRTSEGGAASIQIIDMGTCFEGPPFEFSCPGVNINDDLTEVTLIDRTGDDGGIIASIVNSGKRILLADYVEQTCRIQDISGPLGGIQNALFWRGSMDKGQPMLYA